MDPVSAAEIASKVYQATGLIGLLLLGMCLLVYAGYRDAKVREKNLCRTIAACQEKHEAIAQRATEVSARSVAAIESNNKVVERICTVIDTEFRRRDDTPLHGNDIKHR